MNDSVVRTVQERRPAQASLDGAGVAIQRVAGFGHAGMDPVLMIDELRSEHREDFAAGFPPHPHRGMQTLTYMKHGGSCTRTARAIAARSAVAVRNT
jgi:redox-sensitive bicupin YhaK (pirin superfamily)